LSAWKEAFHDEGISRARRSGCCDQRSTGGGSPLFEHDRCSGWRNGQCVAWNRLTRKQAAEVAVGTVFGPNYSYYAPFNTIPQTVVTQYHLEPSYKYVTADGYTYVVDPHTYAVTQVIAPGG
jgi:hypothetical protein